MTKKNQTTFWDHLDELRSRLMICLYIFFAGFLLFYWVSDSILDFLRYPLFSQLPVDKQKLYYTGLFENFLVHLKISGYASLVVLSPAYFLVLWQFIAPGLTNAERKNVRPFVLAGSFFFLAGSAFAYFVLFPAGIKFFLSYGSSAEVAWLTLDRYIALILRILFGFGACFQLPVLVVLMAKIGFITADKLKTQRRIALCVVAAISALVAPPDAVSMLLLMGPLYLLFEGSLFVVQIIEKKNPSK